MQPAKQCGEGDLTFDAGKRGAEAEMRRPAECEVAIIRPGQVQSVGIGKALRVAIAGRHDSHYGIALADPLPTQLHVVRGEPRRMLARALVAQQLLDRGLDDRRVVAQSCQVFWVPEQS